MTQMFKKKHSMHNLIKFDDYSTFPSHIIKYIRQHKNLLVDKSVKDILTFELRWVENIENNNSEFISFRDELANMLCECSMEMYHLTKALSEDSFYKDGIQLLAPENYVRHMAETFNNLSLPSKWKDRYFDLIVNFANDSCQMAGREYRISLFAPASNELIYDENYIGMYAAVIGGEFAKFAFKRDREAYEKWKTYGTPLLIKTVIKFDSLIKESSEVNFDGSIIMFLRCVLQYEKWLPMEKIVFIAQTDRDIFPQNIIDIQTINYD